MELVKAKIAEKQTGSTSNDVHPLSLDDDPLSQVFPKKLKGGLRGVGSHVTRRQYDAALPAHIMYSEEKAEKEVMVKKYDKMDNKLDFVVDFCTKYIPPAGATGEASTPTIPMMIPTPGQFLSGMNSATSARNEPTPSAKIYELLDWEGNCVAIAKEVTDPIHRGKCHNYVLDPLLELKVSMVTRKMFGVKLYKAAKNLDAKKIGEVGIDDFLVWPKSHIRYVENE